MAPVVVVHGARNLARTLREFGDGLDDLKDANASVSDYVARESAARAPRKTGALSGSVRGSRQAAKAIVRAGSAKVLYAGPIHWGWPARHIAPNRFIWDTAQDTQGQWIGDYEANIQRLADKVEGM